MLRRHIALIAAAFTAALVAVLLKQAPGAAPAAKSPPGLSVRFESLAGGGGAADTRHQRMCSLYVPENAAPTPFIPPGRFRATFEGNIELRLRDEYAFSADGRGTFKLVVNGQTVLETSGEDLSKTAGKPVRLNKGKNAIVATYESPEKGDAVLRLYWQGSDFLREPVATMNNNFVFTYDPEAKPLADGMRIREGRFLFASLRCARCHTSPDVPVGGSSPEPGSAKAEALGMPELSMDAPDLSDAGARLNPAWVAAWVSNPRLLRPAATMPRLLHGVEAQGSPDKPDPRAADIAAYLATLGADAPKDQPAPAADEEKAAAGGRLFANLGCVVCHTLPDNPDPTSDATRIPLAYVKAKYKPAALRDFLRQPEKRYHWVRMPNFRFTEKELDGVMAFLLSKEGKPVPQVDAGDAGKGKQLVESSGCLNCHTIGTQKSAASTPELAKLGDASKGCVAPQPPEKAADFSLTDGQRRALESFLKTDRGAALSSLKRDAAPEFAERQIANLRCTACHARDREQNLLDTYADEVGALASLPPGPDENGQYSQDQSPPILTWVGEKLRPGWMATFIGGKLPYKPRTFLRMRMPGFPARAAGVAAGLALEHGFPDSAAPLGKSDPERAKIGMTLSSRNGGFSCIQCHGVNKLQPLAPFEAPSINFMYVAERLRHEYYFRWMRNPLRIDPATKMPQFSPDGKQTALRDILGGDADKQFEAIYQYLLEGHAIVPPE